TVTAWWHTSFVPPEPKSTSRVILDQELPAGPHAIAIPGEVPAQASFATVSIGPSVHAFIVRPMPSGTTPARFPDPPSAQHATLRPSLGGRTPLSYPRAEWPGAARASRICLTFFLIMPAPTSINTTACIHLRIVGGAPAIQQIDLRTGADQPVCRARSANEGDVMPIRFPGESAEYRAARDRLLEREIELRRAMEAVAVARRALPPGGALPQDHVL